MHIFHKNNVNDLYFQQVRMHVCCMTGFIKFTSFIYSWLAPPFSNLRSTPELGQFLH